jgi:16S rRNA (adenine1518-N6/adenine1519-N6)-dimethyltransferase
VKVRAKKHLGQHFLKDDQIAKSIVDSYFDLNSDNFLIEVGPGTGVLTKFILEKQPKNFSALDVDAESIEYLKNNYPQHSDKFHLLDFLESDMQTFTSGKWNVIGNFPYNISSQIMFRVLEYRNQVDFAVGMFQKEVAVRICSDPGSKEYGILSVLLQAFYEVKYLFTVQPGSFNPPPKVKSGVIRLSRNSTAKLDCDEALFFRVVKTGFNQRRKTLRNALKPILENKTINSPLMDKRAEQLSVKDFIDLTKLVQQSACK